MTVFAWDGTTLAADRRCMIGGVIFESTKIRTVNGALLALAGAGHRLNQCVEWYRAGADVAAYPQRAADDESVMVCIVREGGIVRIRRYESGGSPLELDGRLYADGAGRDCAMAAMLCGKTAREAVEITAQLIASCGGGVDTLTFDDG